MTKTSFPTACLRRADPPVTPRVFPPLQSPPVPGTRQAGGRSVRGEAVYTARRRSRASPKTKPAKRAPGEASGPEPREATATTTTMPTKTWTTTPRRGSRAETSGRAAGTTTRRMSSRGTTKANSAQTTRWLSRIRTKALSCNSGTARVKCAAVRHRSRQRTDQKANQRRQVSQSLLSLSSHHRNRNRNPQPTVYPRGLKTPRLSYQSTRRLSPAPRQQLPLLNPTRRPSVRSRCSKAM